MDHSKLKLIECPRDAMQGLKKIIPTQWKMEYINTLLQVGFDTIDFGSFVSPKAIPQMADTAEVLKGLELNTTSSSLLAIVGNVRGAQQVCAKKDIQYAGFPFSISPTFLAKNINSDIEHSFATLQQSNSLLQSYNKELVAYISMAFGNPYHDEWSMNLLMEWVERIIKEGVGIIAISDTVGLASPEVIREVFAMLSQKYSHIEFGLHLHTTSHLWREKVEAAYEGGCRRFDGVLNGLGGCPMAGEDLVGNVRTTDLFRFFRNLGVETNLNEERLQHALELARELI